MKTTAPKNLLRLTFNPRLVVQAVAQAKGDPEMKAGLLVEREAKLSMHKGGRFEGPRGGKMRIPSEPGDPPNVQTGNLRGSITTARENDLFGRVIVGPTRAAWYGRLHEHGGRHHPKRPFMRPALVEVRQKFPALFLGLKLAKTPAGQKLNSKKGQPR